MTTLYNLIGYGAILIPLMFLYAGICLFFRIRWSLIARVCLLLFVLIPYLSIISHIYGWEPLTLFKGSGGELGDYFAQRVLLVTSRKLLLYALYLNIFSYFLAVIGRPRGIHLSLLTTALTIAYIGNAFIDKKMLNIGLQWFVVGGFLVFIYAYLKGKWVKRYLPGQYLTLSKPQLPLSQQELLGKKPMGKTVEILLLIAVLSVGLFFRIYRIPFQPAGCYYDEAVRGQESFDRLKLPLKHQRIKQDLFRNPLIYWYMEGFAQWFFGKNPQAIRVPSIIFGLLTVLLTYLFGRHIFGAGIGLLAALMVATSHWHVNFSRISFGGIQTPFFVVLMSLFFFKALSGRWLNWLWFFITLVLGFPSYSASRLMVVLPLALFLHLMVVKKWFLNWRFWAVLLVIVLVFGAGYKFWFALFKFDFAESKRLFDLMIFVGVDRSQWWDELKPNIERYFWMFHHMGDGNPRHNLPMEPALEYYLRILFPLGLVFCLYRWRDPRYFYLMVWFVVMMMPGVLSREGPHFLRTLGTIPAVMFFCAIFVGQAYENYRAAMGRYLGWTALVPIVILCISLISHGYETYFVKMGNDPRNWREFDTEKTKVAEYVNSLNKSFNKKYKAILINEFHGGSPAINFVLKDRSLIEQLTTIKHIPIKEKTKVPYIFVYDHTYLEVGRQLRSYYPDGLAEVHRDPWNKEMFYTFIVTPDQVEELFGLTGEYYLGNKALGEPLFVRRDDDFAFEWNADTMSLTTPFTVKWHGALYIPSDGEYSFALVGNNDSQLILDGRKVDTSRSDSRTDRSPTLKLGMGYHNLDITLTVTKMPVKFNLMWALPGEKSYQPIPLRYLCSRKITDPTALGNIYSDRKITLTLEATYPISSDLAAEGIQIRDLAVDDAGYIFVSFNDAIMKLSPRGEKLTEWGGFGFKDEQFRSASGIAVAPDQGLYVIDSWNVLLKKFSNDGKFLWKKVMDLWAANDVNIDTKRRLMYVADSGKHRVIQADLNGNFIRNLGTMGAEPGKFRAPVSAVANSKGEVFACDFAQPRVTKFKPDGSYDTLWFVSGMNEFSYMAVDKNDTLYLSIPNERRIAAFEPSGDIVELSIVYRDHKPRLSAPAGIDSKGDYLYVADRNAKNVFVFRIQH